MRILEYAALIWAMSLVTFVATAQNQTVGGIRGKVRVERGSPSGVAVIVRRGEQEVTRATTDRNGEFLVAQLPPGVYGLTVRKAGLSVATIENIEVKPGKVRSLADKLFLAIDQGSIAFIRGSVFDSNGRSFGNARVELARIQQDGSLKKLDTHVTPDTGEFGFRVPPDAAKYRVTATADHMQSTSRDVSVESALVYRVALSLLPKQ